jgi:uncharacterized protein (TIGR02001 family)
MKFTLKALSLALVASASTVTFAAETTSPHSISGNIGLVSEYVLRGNTDVLENDDVAIQGGLDYSHASGFYAGYWGSTLGYYDLDDDYDKKAFENDFYAGYNGKITEDLSYTVGVTYYYYMNSDVDSDFFESLVGIDYKGLSVTAQTALEDSVFANAGDTYVAASYSYALPQDFSLNGTLAVQYNHDSGKYEGSWVADTEKDFNFRHFTVGLSKPIANTGVTASMDYIFAGDLRDGTDLDDKVVFGLKYEF